MRLPPVAAGSREPGSPSPQAGAPNAPSGSSTTWLAGRVLKHASGQTIVALPGSVVAMAGLADLAPGTPLRVAADHMRQTSAGDAILVVLPDGQTRTARAAVAPSPATIVAEPGVSLNASLSIDGQAGDHPMRVRIGSEPPISPETADRALLSGAVIASLADGPRGPYRAIVAAQDRTGTKLALTGGELVIPHGAASLQPGLALGVTLLSLLTPDEARLARRSASPGLAGTANHGLPEETLLPLDERLAAALVRFSGPSEQPAASTDLAAHVAAASANEPPSQADAPTLLGTSLGSGDDARLQMVVDPDPSGGRAATSKGASLLIELELSRIGRLRLELLESAGRLELIVRSEATLDPASRTAIADIFLSACEIGGHPGVLAFRPFVRSPRPAALPSRTAVLS